MPSESELTRAILSNKLETLYHPMGTATLEAIEEYLLLQLAKRPSEQIILAEALRPASTQPPYANTERTQDKKAVIPVGYDNYKQIAEALFKETIKLKKEKLQEKPLASLTARASVTSDLLTEEDRRFQDSLQRVGPYNNFAPELTPSHSVDSTYTVKTLWRVFELQQDENGFPSIKTGRVDPETHQPIGYVKPENGAATAYHDIGPANSGSVSDELTLLLYWLKHPAISQKTGNSITGEALEIDDRAVQAISSALDKPEFENAKAQAKEKIPTLEGENAMVLLESREEKGPSIFWVHTGRLIQQHEKQIQTTLFQTQMSVYTTSQNSLSIQRALLETTTRCASLPYSMATYYLIKNNTAFLLAAGIVPLMSTQRKWVHTLESNGDPRNQGANYLAKIKSPDEDVPVSDILAWRYALLQQVLHGTAPFFQTTGAAEMLQIIGVHPSSPLFWLMLIDQFTRATMISYYALNECFAANPEFPINIQSDLVGSKPLDPLIKRAVWRIPLQTLNAFGLLELSKQIRTPMAWALYTMAFIYFINLMSKENAGNEPTSIALAIIAGSSQALYTQSFDVPRFQQIIHELETHIKNSSQISSNGYVQLGANLMAPAWQDKLHVAAKFMQLFPNAFWRHLLGNSFVQYTMNGTPITQLETLIFGRQGTDQLNAALKIILGSMIGFVGATLLYTQENKSQAATTILAVLAGLILFVINYTEVLAGRDRAQSTIIKTDQLTQTYMQHYILNQINLFLSDTRTFIAETAYSLFLTMARNIKAATGKDIRQLPIPLWNAYNFELAERREETSERIQALLKRELEAAEAHFQQNIPRQARSQQTSTPSSLSAATTTPLLEEETNDEEAGSSGETESSNTADTQRCLGFTKQELYNLHFWFSTGAGSSMAVLVVLAIASPNSFPNAVKATHIHPALAAFITSGPFGLFNSAVYYAYQEAKEGAQPAESGITRRSSIT